MAKKPEKDAPANFYGLPEDEIIQRMEAGESASQIARSIGRAKSALSVWLRSDPERSARARDAVRSSAEANVDEAEQLLRSAANPFELARAREMASHLRWKASKADAAKYGDKLAIGGAEDLPPVKTLSDEQLLARIDALKGKIDGK